MCAWPCLVLCGTLSSRLRYTHRDSSQSSTSPFVGTCLLQAPPQARKGGVRPVNAHSREMLKGLSDFTRRVIYFTTCPFISLLSSRAHKSRQRKTESWQPNLCAGMKGSAVCFEACILQRSVSESAAAVTSPLHFPPCRRSPTGVAQKRTLCCAADQQWATAGRPQSPEMHPWPLSRH